MSNINDIGINLFNYVDNVNDNNSKTKLLLLLEQLNNNNRENDDLIINAKILYDIKYEQPRITNNINYTDYVNKREILYNNWILNKNLNNLIELVKLLPPENKLIDDIYTYTFLLKNKSTKPKDVIKHKPKEIKDDNSKKNVKPTKVVKTKEENKVPKPEEIEEIEDDEDIKDVKPKKELVIPDNKVLNPATGRLILKNSAYAKKHGLNKK